MAFPPVAYRYGAIIGRQDSSLLVGAKLCGAHCRFSTTRNPSSPSERVHKNDHVLYKRSPDRLMVPRLGIAATTLHTIYWSWYVLDFVPAINAASRASAEAAVQNDAVQIISGVDPTVGYVGFGLAIFMSIGSAAYPRHLVSEIRKGGDHGSLLVGTHSLPFVVPQTEMYGLTEYPAGAATIDSKSDAKRVLTDYGGDLRNFRGHLALRAEGSRGNLLLNVGEGDTFQGRRHGELLGAILPKDMMGQQSAADAGENVEEWAERKKFRRGRGEAMPTSKRAKRDRRRMVRRRQQ